MLVIDLYSPNYLFTFEELERCGKIADVVDSLQLSSLHGLQQTGNTDFKLAHIFYTELQFLNWLLS